MRNHTGSVDVIVVGAGLAGLTASALLADAGRRVALFERADAVGGRAITHVKDGYHFNFGPHAWYMGGPGTGVLTRLGFGFEGGPPQPHGGFALDGDRLHTLPVGFVSLLTTDLLSLHGKLEAASLLARLPRLDVSGLAGMTIGDWLAREVDDERARAMVNMFIRVAAYVNAPGILSAEAGLEAFQTVLRENVRYLDGGWRVMVDALRQRALTSGVQVTRSSPVAEVLHHDAVAGVRLADGSVALAPNVILAVPPDEARRLVPHAPAAVRARWTGTPAKAACLDVGLARLPKPSQTVAFGVDRPLYYSVHSAAASLAPRGGAVIHVAKYHDPLQPATEQHDRLELEEMLDRLQPGWRAELVVQRFLPAMTVTHAIPAASTGGLRGRAPVVVTELPGLYLAGDWVGDRGMLAHASVTSAALAAQLTVEHGRRATAVA